MIFPSSVTCRDVRWTDWKSLHATKGGAFQYEEANGVYIVYFYDAVEVYACTIWLGDVPPGDYTQEQNDADKADFETNYKASGNAAIVPKAKDGRETVRVSTTNRMQNFKLRVFSFYTSKTDSLHNVNPVTDADYGDVTVSLYKFVNNGWVATNQGAADATKTVIDWEPHYDYEIIGGYMDTPANLVGGTTDQWYISAVGVPDYPPQYFGSVDYISEVNLEAVTTHKVISDGRAVSFLPYQLNGMPGTNKLRFTVKHPAGAQERFQVYVEHFT